ncbi:hypothetical protein DPMN_084331 [Dreissena polymorpha]|uniref:Uncharacterized protein n=1 Tax=Dreissena polymorpha TaxID=45954 RepID=A0A9D3YDM4_DREPO|nr:hypothetical protein DPMN_084331 [Dreissena polymorpha]
MDFRTVHVDHYPTPSTLTPVVLAPLSSVCNHKVCESLALDGQHSLASRAALP